jgi:pimeloyl-ACP methyl ester carboxylesterase
MTRVAVDGAELEVFEAGSGARVVGAAHPATAYGPETAALLAELGGARVVCVNPRGVGGSSGGPASLERMVDDVEAVRRRLGLPPWVFWGLSGGGWLAQLHARRHPDAVAGIIVESACLCFRERLADPACALSPAFPAWGAALAAAGLLDAGGGGELEWVTVAGVGEVLRRRGGGAVLVSPAPIDDGMKRAMPVLLGFDARPWIREVRAPALVIAGGADPVVPPHRVRAVHEGIPGSSFVLVEGGGHVPSSERRQEAVAAIRDFLTLAGR